MINIKPTTITFIVISVMILAACKSKKSVTSTVTPTPVVTAPAPTPTNVSTNDFMVSRPASGVYAPGNEELTAIKAQHTDATLEQLQTGYQIYTKGACINCHGALDIYTRSEAKWKDIIDNMALRARLSDTQKDAVYKYVFAIKAVQPK